MTSPILTLATGVVIKYLLRVCFFVALLSGQANGQSAAVEIDDLKRSPNDFSYFRLGAHVPTRK